MTCTMIWVHGWGTSSRVWEDAPLLLPGAIHRFVSYAGCDTADELREAVRRELAEACREAGSVDGSSHANEIVVVGWSLGAMLALECLFEGSAAPAALVVVGGTLRFVDRERTRGWPERVVARMRTRLAAEPEETLRSFSEAMFADAERIGAGSEGKRFNGWLERLGETDFSADGLAAGLAYLQSADLGERWIRWRAEQEKGSVDRRPMLLWLHGDRDPICPPGAIPEDLHKEERTIMPGAGHAPFLTGPDAFYERLERLLHDLFFWD